jgi:putative DNA primase/helicase
MDRAHGDAQEVRGMSTKELARGKWQSILMSLGGIAPGALTGRHGPCPVNGEGHNRFRFSNKDGRGNFFCACNPDGKGDGFDLLKCARGWEFREAALEVERSIGVMAEDVARKRKTDEEIRSALLAVARTFADKPLHVGQYLASRGLTRPPSIRQAFTGYGLDTDRRYDAMACVISDPAGNPVSMHLTYLEAGQKAPIEPCRVVMTPKTTIKGGAVRLFPMVGGHLSVAEGIESALAARVLSGLPAWALISANGMRDFIPPEGLKVIDIYADTDENYAGQAAAFHLANRIKLRDANVAVRIVMSRSKGEDANDIHNFERRTALIADTNIC